MKVKLLALALFVLLQSVAASAQSRPISVTVTPLAWGFRIAWEDPDLNEGFLIERRTGADGLFIPVASVPPGIRVYEDRDLSLRPGQDYGYRIRAQVAKTTGVYTSTPTSVVTARFFLPGTGVGVGLRADLFPPGAAALPCTKNSAFWTADVGGNGVPGVLWRCQRSGLWVRHYTPFPYPRTRRPL